MYDSIMNRFEFKNLVKNLKDSLKEKTFFKDLRKEVNTGANGDSFFWKNCNVYA